LRAGQGGLLFSCRRSLARAEKNPISMDLVDRLRGVLGNAGEGKVFDSSSRPSDRQCTICDSIFGTVVRRLACRLCGRAVCQDCAKNGVPAPVGSLDPGPLRACDYCECIESELGKVTCGLGRADQKNTFAPDAGSHMRQRPHYDADQRQVLGVVSAYTGWVAMACNNTTLEPAQNQLCCVALPAQVG
jgi:hypothetical protein